MEYFVQFKNLSVLARTAKEHLDCNRTECAEFVAREALYRSPCDVGALCILSLIETRKPAPNEALPSVLRAKELAPNDLEVINCCAYIHTTPSGYCDYGEAEMSFRKVLAAEPKSPDAVHNLTCLLHETGRFEEILKLAESESKSLGSKTRLVIAYAYTQLCEYDKAEQTFRKLLTDEPHNCDAHTGLAFLYLRAGRFKEAWEEYEWRMLHFSGVTAFAARFPKIPFWRGESLKGKRILVQREQGVGDAIQMYRFLPLLRELGASSIVLEPNGEALVSLLRASFPFISEYLPSEPSPQEKLPVPDVDVRVLHMSLPHTLKIHDEANIPKQTPYLKVDPALLPLHFPPKRTEFWHPYSDKLKVGLAWSGNPFYGNDRGRSCSLRHFRHIQGPDVTLFSFVKQAGPRSSAGRGMTHLEAGAEDLSLVELAPYLHDYSCTGFLLQQMDLIISVDTGIAHLAGALGLNIWTLLCDPSEWRWQDKRTDSPWYPTMRLFRQARKGEWEPVFEEVYQALKKLKARHFGNIN